MMSEKSDEINFIHFDNYTQCNDFVSYFKKNDIQITNKCCDNMGVGINIYDYTDNKNFECILYNYNLQLKNLGIKNLLIKIIANQKGVDKNQNLKIQKNRNIQNVEDKFDCDICMNEIITNNANCPFCRCSNV